MQHVHRLEQMYLGRESVALCAAPRLLALMKKLPKRRNATALHCSRNHSNVPFLAFAVGVMALQGTLHCHAQSYVGAAHGPHAYLHRRPLRACKPSHAELTTLRSCTPTARHVNRRSVCSRRPALVRPVCTVATGIQCPATVPFENALSLMHATTNAEMSSCACSLRTADLATNQAHRRPRQTARVKVALESDPIVSCTCARDHKSPEYLGMCVAQSHFCLNPF